MLLQAEKKILEEISRSSRVAQLEIQTLLSKVYSDELALDLNRQAARYSRIQEKAEEALIREGERPEIVGVLDRSRRWASLQAETALNVSTSHVAELFLREEQKRLDGMMDIVREQGSLNRETDEIAEELMDFEEENIRILGTYLK
ncbi:MAG: hypothetical protein SOZ59_12180 [Candidatus Limivivens sp.]|nr:hypothetical protein [Candidatus Limivivens sp.]